MLTHSYIAQGVVVYSKPLGYSYHWEYEDKLKQIYDSVEFVI